MTEADKPAEIASANDTANFPATARPEGEPTPETASGKGDTLTPVTEARAIEAGRNKGGAPAGNRNALRHGLRSSSLPDGCSYIAGQVKALRRAVRDEVKRVHGGAPSMFQEATIQSICRHEQRALLAYRWLRLGGDTMTTKERVALLDSISKATQLRDQCIRLLRIDKEADLIATWYRAPDEAPESPVATQEATPCE